MKIKIIIVERSEHLPARWDGPIRSDRRADPRSSAHEPDGAGLIIEPVADVYMSKPRCIRLKSGLMDGTDTAMLTAIRMHADDLALRHAACMFLYRKG